MKGKWDKAIKHLVETKHISRKEALKILRRYNLATMYK